MREKGLLHEPLAQSSAKIVQDELMLVLDMTEVRKQRFQRE